jgi:predicted restriction endonuclease
MSKLATYSDPHICYFCGIKKTITKKKCRSIVEIHHIIEKQDGGSNELSNLVPACSNHHSAIHENLIKLDKWYFSTRGWILHWWDENGNEHWDKRII